MESIEIKYNKWNFFILVIFGQTALRFRVKNVFFTPFSAENEHSFNRNHVAIMFLQLG